MEVTFFDSPRAFRAWLERHHASASEMWVGFHRKHARRAGLTYREALDEALCFGWIDGIRKRVDDESYTQRFTPRRPRSIWSTINITRVEQLTAEGRMAPAGLKAFEARTARRSGVYSFEQRAVSLDETLERRFRSEREAWRFFAQQPPGYQRVATWFVMSAVKPETRLRRLEKLIDDSAHRRRLGLLGGKAPASTAARSRRPATTGVKRRSRP